MIKKYSGVPWSEDYTYSHGGQASGSSTGGGRARKDTGVGGSPGGV